MTHGRCPVRPLSLYLSPPPPGPTDLSRIGRHRDEHVNRLSSRRALDNFRGSVSRLLLERSTIYDAVNRSESVKNPISYVHCVQNPSRKPIRLLARPSWNLCENEYSMNVFCR